MFPLQQISSTELGFDLGYQIQDDHASMENNLINSCVSSNDSKRTDLGFRRQRQQKECSMRKVVLHREVERKRRQQMSKLHHQIKGNRSVCDETEEAESHIKKMEKNNEELKKGRDKLKSWFEYSSSSSSSSNVDEISSNSVTVNKIGTDGMEILIKTEDLELSRVLAELQNIDDELDVVTIVSTRINGRFLHKIQVQARDMKNLGVLMLQDRLIKAIM